ncbi:MAG: hypothetical protein ACRECD_10885 [Burkholderiaceae bacterium]
MAVVAGRRVATAAQPFSEEHKDSPPSRTRRQERAIERLSDARSDLERWHGKSFEEIEQAAPLNKRAFEEAQEEFEKAMVNAIRLGLADHPMVRAWIVTQRGLGARDTLRRARSGVEAGVKRPLGLGELGVIYVTVTLAQLGQSPADVHRILAGRGPLSPSLVAQLTELGRRGKETLKILGKRPLLAPMTRQAFYKLLDRLDLDGHF